MYNSLDQLKQKMQNAQWLDKLSPIILLILILYLCWKLASLFWLVIAPPQNLKLEPVMLGSQQQQLPNISQFPLFYEAGQTAANSNDQVEMFLQGVMVGYPQQFSSAVIKIAEKSDRYRVGESIEGTSYQLAEVYWDRVTLRQNNGATRTLEFQGIPNGLDQSSLTTVTAQPTLNSSHNPPQVDQQLGQATQQLQDIREQYLQQMGVQATGQGYEISQRTPAALRQKLGLQPGDRILSLNGQTTSSGQTEAQLLEQARQQGQVRLEIQRGDQVMTVQQDFK